MPSVPLRSLSLALGLLSAACAHSTSSGADNPGPKGSTATTAPSPDPRVGLRAGKMDAAEAVWNLRVLSKTPPPQQFVDESNSDLAFKDHYAIQGNYNGYQVWDITDPRKPTLTTAYLCPASQSDVSVYQNLLFVSGENLAARLDCGTEGVADTVARGLAMMLMVNVPATLGLIVLATPIVEVLFERGRFGAADTAATAWALRMYAVGLVGYSAVRITSPTFYALGRPRVKLRTWDDLLEAAERVAAAR